MNADDALALARRWAARGIPAFPIAIGHDGTRMSKRPLCTHGHHDGTTDPHQLAELFRRATAGPHETYGVGLWPGPAGWAVVDVDVKDGAGGDDTWAALAAAHDTVETYTAVTASGGLHVWGGKGDHHIGNTKTLGPGIDVRSDAGWVVAPGVTTPWGSWDHEASSPPWPPVRWPNWMLGRLDGNGAATSPDGFTQTNASRADVDWWMAAPTIGPGERHASLVSAAGWCRRRAMTSDAAMTFLVGVLAKHQPARHAPEDIARLVDDIYKRYPAGAQLLDDHDAHGGQDGSSDGRTVDLTPAASIRPKRVRWAWTDRIAIGTIALLAGAEGLGKSTVAYWLAAQLSRGLLPGEHYGIPKSVLVCATEDSWAHTIVPRLMAHGADLNRVYRVQVKDGDTDLGLSLPADLDQLAGKATRANAAMLVLDPLMSRLHDSLDTHRDGDVRRALEPLADMAETTGMAILGIIHHNKSGSTDPLQLVMASKAFAAVARSVHTVIRDPDDDTQTQKLFGTSKNNLGPLDLATLAFAIQPWAYPTDDGDGTTGQILWGPERQETIGEALARTVRDPDEKSALDEAVEWLAGYLDDAGGRAEAADAQAAGRAAGHNERTLRRARVKLKVEKRKIGYQGAWEWFLPDEADKAVKGPQDPNPVPLAPLDGQDSQRGPKGLRGQKYCPGGGSSSLPGNGSTLSSPGPLCLVCRGAHHPATLHRCQCPACAGDA